MTRTLRTLIVVVALTPLTLTAQAGPEDHPAELIDVLGYLDVPLTAELLEAAGADAELLTAVAHDVALLPYVRLRAASALVLYPTEATQATLTELALDTATDREVRIAAVSALGYLQVESAQPVLLRLIEVEQDEAVRDAAVRARERGLAQGERAPQTE